MVRNKARLVAQRHTQEEGVDYDKVFSPIARIKAIRLFLAYASFNGFLVYQMDVKSVFLYGKIEEEVYTMGSKEENLTRPYLSKGIKVKQKKDEIFICQDKYVADILKKFGFTKVNNASTPMETQKPLLKDEDGEEVYVHMYRTMIGSLMYLTSSRPDIMFAVCACARYQVNPKVSHLYGVKRIFRHTLTTAGFKLLLLGITYYCQWKVNAARHNLLMLEQLWSTVVAKTINEEAQIQAKVDGKKVTQVPQLSDPMEHVTDEVLHKELGDRLVRAATTASSLEAEQDSDNINRTQSKATPNESSSQGIDSAGGPRCQETMGDTTAQTRVNTYEDFRTELVQGQEKEKRASEELIQKRVKKQKVEDDKETAELKQLMEVIPYKEEVAIDAIALAVNQMLESFDREGLEDLYKLVKAKYGSTRPVEDLDLLLWGDLKTMFEPHAEDDEWRKEQGYKVLEWKLYDSCRVHSLRMQSMWIYMLVEKTYPLAPPTLTMMLEENLQSDYYCQMAYQLLKLIVKQLKM
uniref:Reverse transcriptase Ty1/copia-type domain-containing protein n=1 Tax=Tanacetum cinerariifolium TaxID=118510 RepID=A0A6L2MIU2_TANCI|nr:hypothetical protein [Tanacetum cinerariifolium]